MGGGVHFSVVLRNVLIVFKTTHVSVELEQHARPNKYIYFIFMSSLLFIGKRQNCMLSIYLMNIDCNMRRIGSEEIEIGINVTGKKL